MFAVLHSRTIYIVAVLFNARYKPQKGPRNLLLSRFENADCDIKSEKSVQFLWRDICDQKFVHPKNVDQSSPIF